MASSATISINGDGGTGLTVRPNTDLNVVIAYTNASGDFQTVRQVILTAALHNGSQKPNLPVRMGQVEVPVGSLVKTGGVLSFTGSIRVFAPQANSANQEGFQSSPPASVAYDIGATIYCSSGIPASTPDDVVPATVDVLTVESPTNN